MLPASHSTSRLSTVGRLERRTGPFRPYQWRKCLFSFVSIALFGGHSPLVGPRGGSLLLVGGG